MPIVTDAGFRAETPREWRGADDLGEGAGLSVRLANDQDPAPLAEAFDRIETIAVDFPSFSDGRGFSLARRLRALGFRGRLRARGRLIADQYPLARAVGFDEVEVGAEIAARQAEASWRAAARRGAPLYRLRQAAAGAAPEG